ncbi:MAG: 2-hydroxyacyl-CoA dehydratase, partial [Ruminiclostridium sp.]|nr:2-hydroxyacyl-CoA dehydratase [Ruminiclostridium sp.]
MNPENRVEFTKDMMDYTLLAPNMADIHFSILCHIFAEYGYKVELLKNDGRAVVDEGLKYVHNDTCYPALLVIGQLIDALNSGKYDVNKTALMITQSGGGCRASNYIPLIRKALKAEFPKVPVISLNFSGLEKDSGFPINLKTLLKLAYGIFYGDSLMSLYNQSKPYEINQGDSDKAREKALKVVLEAFEKGKYTTYKKIHKAMFDAFSSVEKSGQEKVKVGIVGEIYVKYSPLGNSHLEDFLLSEDCEPVVPALMDFVMYCAVNNINDEKL